MGEGDSEPTAASACSSESGRPRSVNFGPGAGVVSALVMEVSGVSGSGKARQRASPGQGRSGLRSKEDAGRSRSPVPAGSGRVWRLNEQGDGHEKEIGRTSGGGKG